MEHELTTIRQEIATTPPGDESSSDEKRHLLSRALTTDSGSDSVTSVVLSSTKEVKMAALSNGFEYDLLGSCDTDPLFANEASAGTSERRSGAELNGQMRLVLNEADDRSESSSLLLADEACDHHHRGGSGANSGFSHHDHCHSTVSEDKLARNKLIAVSGLCLLFMIAEITGGLIANSLAVVSDASHLACDLAGFLVSLFAIWIAKKPPTKTMSFGYHRAEVLGAMGSVLIIWIITAVLVFLGIKRIKEDDYEVGGETMLITACVGVGFNILMGVVLHSGIANCDIKGSFGHGHSHSHGHSHHGNSVHHDDHSHGSSHGHSHSHSHGHSHSHSHGANSAQSSTPTSGTRLDHNVMPFDDSMDLTMAGVPSPSSSISNHLMLSDSNENFQLPPLNSIPSSDRSQWCAYRNHANRRNSNDDDDDDNLIDVINHNVGGHLESEDGPQRKKVNINVRAAMVHVIGDFVQSIGVLIAAIIINYKPEYKIADPICTFIFSFLVLCTTFSILKDVISVIMEAVPRDVDMKGIKVDLKNISGIKSVHSLNVWALTLDRMALSVHLGVDVPPGDWQNVLRTATTLLRQKHHMFQSTIQVEQYEDAMRSCVHCHSD